MRAYTPTQRRMLQLLADGQPHTITELIACLNDDLGGAVTVRVHIHRLRKILPRGEHIYCFRDRYIKTAAKTGCLFHLKSGLNS